MEDDVSDKEIKRRVMDHCDYYINYEVESGYIEETRTEKIYRKKEDMG